MSAVFADTSFYLALLNPRDRHHGNAVEASRRPHRLTVTTEFVLLEVGNALSGTGRGRDRFLALLQRITQQRAVTVVPASHEAFAQGVERFRHRRDKTW